MTKPVGKKSQALKALNKFLDDLKMEHAESAITGKVPGAAKKKKKPGRSTDYRDSHIRGDNKKYKRVQKPGDDDLHPGEDVQFRRIMDRIEGKSGKDVYKVLEDANIHPDVFEDMIYDSIKFPKKAGGGKVGMSHQGLYPAEEARAGTMSEMERAKHMKKGGQVKGVKFKDLGKNKVKMKLPKTKVKFKDLGKNKVKMELPKKKSRGGQISEEQGYKDRKDESIAMRVKKKRTKKQLVASRDESYGKWGSKAKKRGKINRSSSKGWDGNTEVSRHYDS